MRHLVRGTWHGALVAIGMFNAIWGVFTLIKGIVIDNFAEQSALALMFWFIALLCLAGHRALWNRMSRDQ